MDSNCLSVENGTGFDSDRKGPKAVNEKADNNIITRAKYPPTALYPQ